MFPGRAIGRWYALLLALTSLLMVVSLVAVPQVSRAPLLNQQVEQHFSGPENHDLALISRSSGEDGLSPDPEQWTEPPVLAWSSAPTVVPSPRGPALDVQGRLAWAKTCHSARGPPA